jgi:hypothetical protein
MLRAEIAGLRNSVLALTRHPAEGAPVLEIVGMRQPERLTLAGPLMDGPDRFYRVSITYADQLSARCAVAIADPAEFLRFFEDLARRKDGWEGENQVASLEGQLAITCRYEGKRQPPEISVDVSCAVDYPSFDPYWAVQLRMEVDPASLGDLASQARAVFGNTRAEPGPAVEGGREAGSS